MKINISVSAILLLAAPRCHGFVTPSKSAFTTSPYRRTAASTKNAAQLAAVPETAAAISEFSSTLLSYTDDPLGDLLVGVNGVVVAGIFASFIAIGVGFKALLPSVGKNTFILTPEEVDAVSRVSLAFDAKAWEQEDTEEGTKGYVNRRRKANEAKESYQSQTSGRNVKDRSLRYSETELGFVASLVREAEPSKGDLFVDLGSGTGRSTLAAAAAFPGFKKCVGVEFLAPLVKLSNGYKGKVRGKKAPVEFVNADFAEYDLSDADVVFASATYYNNGDLEKALETLPSGAMVATIDKRLGGGYQLITEVEDPNGDLVLNTGYLFQKN